MGSKFNAAFWKWFGDSKVVDFNGNPLVVYHGTDKVFRKYNTPAFFTTNKKHAAGYPGDSSTAMVASAYVKISRPFTAKYVEHIWEDPYRPRWISRKIADGYDGIFYNGNAGEGDYWVAFHPTQIKSATGNDGTWDADDPDIRSNPSRSEILEIVSLVPKLKYRPISNVVWETIGAEGLDEEQNSFKKSDWLMADLPISSNDSKALAQFDEEAVEAFNRFDIELKKTYGLRYIDLIDYDTGKIVIVTRK